MPSRQALTVLRLDDGRELAFADWGDPTWPVVFAFHGTPGSHRQVASLGADGAECDVRVIAPDRPGYGHSSYDPQRRLLDWPRDVITIADHLGISRFGVVGISGGGPHAAVCGFALADRLTGCVIASGIGTTSDPADAVGMMPANRGFLWLARHAPFLLPLPFRLMGWGARHLPQEKLLAQMKSQLPPADVAIIDRPGVAEDLLAELQHQHPAAAKAAAQDFALFAKPWGFRIEDIAGPVDVWHGDADVNVPLGHGQRYADLLPDATFHVEPGMGHLLSFDRGREILAAAVG